MNKRLSSAVAIVLMVVVGPVQALASVATGSDPEFQALIESTQPSGYIATRQFPNVGSLGADALSGLNPDGAVFTPQEFADHQIGFYGWHWISNSEAAGSRRVINVVGLSSTSAAEPRELVALLANELRAAGKKGGTPPIAGSTAFTGTAPDGKQASLDVTFIRNDRAFVISAFGNDAGQLQSDVASLSQQLAVAAEVLPSRVEGGSGNGTVLVIALFLSLAVVGLVVLLAGRSRRQGRKAIEAQLSAAEIP